MFNDFSWKKSKWKLRVLTFKKRAKLQFSAHIASGRETPTSSSDSELLFSKIAGLEGRTGIDDRLGGGVGGSRHPLRKIGGGPGTPPTT